MKQFAVIGAGSFGSSLARALTESGFPVMLIDCDETELKKNSEYVTETIQLDATDEKALRAVGIDSVDGAVVSIGENIEDSIIITMTLKEMGVEYVVAKALSDAHGKILSRVGADRLVFPERDMGKRVARSMVATSPLDYIDFAPGYNIAEIPVPESFYGKSLIDTRLRSDYEIEVVAIKRNIPDIGEDGMSVLKEKVIMVPEPHMEFKKGDLMLVIGRTEKIDEIQGLK